MLFERKQKKPTLRNSSKKKLLDHIIKGKMELSSLETYKYLRSWYVFLRCGLMVFPGTTTSSNPPAPMSSPSRGGNSILIFHGSLVWEVLAQGCSGEQDSMNSIMLIFSQCQWEQDQHSSLKRTIILWQESPSPLILVKTYWVVRWAVHTFYPMIYSNFSPFFHEYYAKKHQAFMCSLV